MVKPKPDSFGGSVVDVHAFTYRAPRFAAALPLEFVIEGVPVPGVSRDLSDKGLSASLAEPVLPGTQGRLRLRIEGCTVELAAEVVSAEFYEAGLRFAFQSEEEQAFVQMVVRVVSRAARRAEPTRVALRA